MRTPALITIVLLAATGVAHADDYDGSSRKDPWAKARFEGAIGALVGSQRIGYIAGTGGGVHFDGGVRLDRLYVYGEYDLLSVGESSYDTAMPVRGFLHRIGGNVRYSLGAIGGKGEIPVRGDFWAEVGAGHEHVQWHEGGVLDRRDLSFGFGAQATFKVGRDKPKFVGVYYALKVWVASAPERKDDDPMCAGPCDAPTGPTPYDFGIFFNFAVPFGR